MMAVLVAREFATRHRGRSSQRCQTNRLPRRINSRRAHPRTHPPFHRQRPRTRWANPEIPAHRLAKSLALRR